MSPQAPDSDPDGSTERGLAGGGGADGGLPEPDAPRWRWFVLVTGAIWFAIVSLYALSGTRREFIGVDDASGSVAHLLAFAGVAAVLYAVFAPGRRRWLVALAVLAVCAAAGAAVELAQLASGGRTAEASDLVFDLVGAWLGLATAALVASTLGWRAMNAGVLALLVLSLAILPFARTTDAFDVASIEETLECPERAFDPATPAGPGAEPLLDFPLSEGQGTEVHERDGRVDLTIGNPGATEWTADGLAITGEPGIASDEPPVDLVEAVQATDEVSVEAWIVPATLPQEGPARVVTISRGSRAGDANVHLGVERRGVSARVRTDCDLFNWTLAEDVLTEGALHHLVMTYRPGELAIYVDGEVVTTRRVRIGTLDIWDDDFRLHLGDEAGGGRQFRGTLGSVALFDEALGAEAVAVRFSAGTG